MHESDPTTLQNRQIQIQTPTTFLQKKGNGFFFGKQQATPFFQPALQQKQEQPEIDIVQKEEAIVQTKETAEEVLDNTGGDSGGSDASTGADAGSGDAGTRGGDANTGGDLGGSDANAGTDVGAGSGDMGIGASDANGGGNMGNNSNTNNSSNNNPLGALQAKFDLIAASEQAQEKTQISPTIQAKSVLFPPMDILQFQLNDTIQLSGSDDASARERIVGIAKAEIGKVKALRKEGIDRLLEYFKVAAPGVWTDAEIEQEAGKKIHWCGIFAVYCIKKGGIDVGNWQMGKGVSAFGTLQKTDNPQPGDIGYMDKNNHHALVEKVEGDIIESIDGNSGIQSEVIRNKRNKKDYVGFFTPFTGNQKATGAATQPKIDTNSAIQPKTKTPFDVLQQKATDNTDFWVQNTQLSPPPVQQKEEKNFFQQQFNSPFVFQEKTDTHSPPPNNALVQRKDIFGFSTQAPLTEQIAQFKQSSVSAPPIQLKKNDAASYSLQLKDNAGILPVTEIRQQKGEENANNAQSNVETQNTSAQSNKLPPAVQAKMEGAFGADFSDVNIHTNSIQAKNINALAYAQGNDVHFAENQYNPDSQSGQELIGHELTHVVQQREGRVQPTVQMQGALVNDDHALENEADQMGAKAARHEVVQEKAETTTQAKQNASANPVQTMANSGVIQGSFLDGLASAAGGVWDATGGQIVDAAGKVIEMGEDFFWSLIEKVSPNGAQVIRKISQAGIVGFLKDELSKVTDKIFARLTNNSGLIAQIMPTFRNLLARAQTILGALATGDCKPLFAAMNELKDVLSQLAGEAWDKITNFLSPIRDFFEEVWQSFGAPVLDWVQKTAGNLWNQIKEFGSNLWKWTEPVRNTLAKAWDWVKRKIGMGGGVAGGDSEDGIIQWVQQKLEEAWTAIKEQLKPLVEPMRKIIAKVKAILPIDAILDLRKTVTEWLDKAAAVGDAMGADGSGTGNEKQQISLRNEILPAVMKVVHKMQDRLIGAGDWVASKIGELGESVDGFFRSLSNIPLVSAAAGALDWLRNMAQNLVNWAKDTVKGAAATISNGMGKIEVFAKKTLDLLEKLGGVVSNLLDKLPDLLLGPAWAAIPDCIKEPVKKFILEQILARVPFFQQLMKVGDIWEKLKNAAMTMLKQVFVDGNLIGAIWTFYRTMLEILNVPPKLVTNLISKGARAMKDILADPFGFLGNFLRTLKTGFLNFLSNIGTHLLNGLGKWLTGQLEGTGVELPQDFSFKEVFKFVASLLGITKDYIVEKIAKHTGKTKEFILKWIERGQKGLEWLQTLLTEGPAGIWKKIQENISNLWDTILDTVAGWIQEQVVQKAIAWIATKLDPTGVMAVITTIIDVMNLIESLAAQLREILEIVNGVVDGIAEIAKGIIDKGAQFVEGALADGIPVALNILAGILGLDGIGDKVKETIKGLREKVDKVIDKIAIGLKKFIAGAVALGKDAANAVLDLLGIKKQFKDKNNEDHTLYFSGNGANVQLMVASTPQLVHDLLAKIYKTPDGKKAKTKIEGILDDINTLKLSITSFSNEADNKKTRKEIEKKVDELSKAFQGISIGGDANMTELKLEFECIYTGMEKEYKGQLKEQQDALNGMTIAKWMSNRHVFEKAGRIEDGNLRNQMGNKTTYDEFKKNQKQKGIKDEKIIKEMWDTYAMAATHRLDQVAGGDHDNFTGMGIYSVNSHIGTQWKSKIQFIVDAVEKVDPSVYGTEKINVKLTLK